MKKTLSVILMAALVVAAFAAAPAEAKKKKKKKVVQRVERVVEIPYQLGGIGISSPAFTGGVCFVDPSMPASCKEIPLQAGETHIKIEIQDVTGTSVPGSINQGDTDGDGFNDIFGQFCGSTPEPLELQDPFAPVSLSMYPGACQDGSGGGIPTTGTIVATLSNMP